MYVSFSCNLYCEQWKMKTHLKLLKSKMYQVTYSNICHDLLFLRFVQFRNIFLRAPKFVFFFSKIIMNEIN